MNMKSDDLAATEPKNPQSRGGVMGGQYNKLKGMLSCLSWGLWVMQPLAGGTLSPGGGVRGIR